MKERVPQPCLCLVTSVSVCGDAETLVSRVAAAVKGGVNMVQLREKDMPGGDLLELALRLKEVTQERALLFVNERIDVALACGAEGVQLGERALPVAEAKRISDGELLIGRSVHSLEGAMEAAEAGADMLMVGTMFATASHPGTRPAGVGLLQEIASWVSLSLIGIGGIEADNAAQVIEAGATGVAVIRSVLAAPDPEKAADAIWQTISQSR
jgi:thiamine-phosphate pyrophosphorylase